jgi:hypothetical protein
MCKGCGCNCDKPNCKGKCGTGKFAKAKAAVKKAVSKKGKK